MTINQLIDKIKDNVEWLQTTEGDEIECISMENLQGILQKYFKLELNLKTDD
jgi:hypothetical protein